MTPDLRWLLWTVALTFAQLGVAVIGANSQVSFARLAGNRDGAVELSGWAGRAQRAHRNTLESLPLFIALVLIAQIAGRADPMTALGAQLFFWGRLAHWLVYLAGIPGLRSAVWFASVLGMILIFVRLV